MHGRKAELSKLANFAYHSSPSFFHSVLNHPFPPCKYFNSNFRICSFIEASRDSRPRFQSQIYRSAWVPKCKRSIFCFRCGDKNHMANEFWNLIRCFKYGADGRKKMSCSLDSYPLPNSNPLFLIQSLFP